MINIGFFGTPFLAKRVLEDLYNSPKVNVCFVVTNIDKPVGRKQNLEISPVKEFAIIKNIPYLQPETLRNNNEFFNTINSYQADYFIVVAYGMILPEEILNMPKKKPINIHVGILPKYRGASPIQTTLISGDEKIGVTIMEITKKMDEGGIVDVLEIPIDKYDTYDIITDKISKISGKFLIDTLDKLEKGILTIVQQDNSKAEYCKKITKNDGLLHFSQDAKKIFYLWRGLTTWPGIYVFFKDKKLIIERCDFIENDNLQAKIGEIILFDNKIGIKCSKGTLILQQVKLEGKKSQEIKEFINGHKDFIGYVFEKTPNNSN